VLPDKFISTSNSFLGLCFHIAKVSDKNIACWLNYTSVRRVLSNNQLKRFSQLPAVNVILSFQNFHINSKKECNHVCVYVHGSRPVTAEDVLNSRSGQVECMLFTVQQWDRLFAAQQWDRLFLPVYLIRCSPAV
jgi:hypothetical protein